MTYKQAYQYRLAGQLSKDKPPTPAPAQSVNGSYEPGRSSGAFQPDRVRQVLVRDASNPSSKPKITYVQDTRPQAVMLPYNGAYNPTKAYNPPDKGRVLYDIKRDYRNLFNGVSNIATGIGDAVGGYAADWLTDKAKLGYRTIKDVPKSVPDLVKHPWLTAKATAKGFMQTGTELVDGIDTLVAKYPRRLGNYVGTKLQNAFPRFSEGVSNMMMPLARVSNWYDEQEEQKPWLSYVRRALPVNPFTNDQSSLVDLNTKAQTSNVMDTTKLSPEGERLARLTGGATNLVGQAFIPGFGMPSTAYKNGITRKTILPFARALAKDFSINAAFEDSKSMAGIDRIKTDREIEAAARQKAQARAEELYQQERLEEGKRKFERTVSEQAIPKLETASNMADQYLKERTADAIWNGDITKKMAVAIRKDPEFRKWLTAVIAEQMAYKDIADGGLIQRNNAMLPADILTLLDMYVKEGEERETNINNYVANRADYNQERLQALFDAEYAKIREALPTARESYHLAQQDVE